MGEVRKELAGKGAWIGAGVLLGVALLFFLLAGINADARKPGRAIILLLVALSSLFLAGFAVFESIRRLGKRVQVCENGLAWKAGSSSGALGWPEIVTVVYQHHIPALVMVFGPLGPLAARFLGRGQLMLTTKTGEVVELPAVHGLYGVSATVCRKIKPHVLPEIERKIEAGEPIEFGPHLLVESKGLRWVDQKVRWRDLDALVVQHRAASPSVLHADASQPPLLDIELGAIPNLHLLLDVVEDRFRVPVRTVGEDRIP
jgi:hypothetical protein